MIDWARVRELRTELGADDFGEIVDLFFEEVEEIISRLRVTKDLKKLEQDLHFLKGSATNLGFSSFSSLCQDGERLSSTGHAIEVDIAEVIEAFEKSKVRFLEGLSNLQAS